MEDYVHLEPDLLAFWKQPKSERSVLLQEWHEELLSSVKDDLKDKMREYDALSKEKATISMERDLDILKDARVIGATTSGAAKYRDLLALTSPGIVIVEEAGEVLEAHVLAALTERSPSSNETKHLILIGDHLQVSHKLWFFSA